MSQRWTTRDGLNLIPETDQKVGAEDAAQNIYARIATANCLATSILDGEGIYAGGAVDETDLGGGGSTYPAVALILQDDSGNYWFKRTTTNTAISFSDAAIPAASLYAVLTDASDGSNPYNDGKEISVEFVAQATASAAPGDSFKIATGVVVGSVFTGLTGQGFSDITYNSTQGLILDAGSASALQLPDTSGTAVGGILFGTDTNLYRASASVLKTDGQVQSASYQFNVPAASNAGFLFYNTTLGVDKWWLAYSSTSDSIVIYHYTDVEVYDGVPFTLDKTNGVSLTAGSASALNLSSTAGDAASGILFGGNVTLYRSADNVLKTDDALIVTGNLTNTTLTATRVPYASTAGLLVDSASMVFDTTNGLKLAAGSASALNLTSIAGTAVGGLLFGADVNLYRSAADVLKTDDAFHCSKAQVNVAAAGEFLTITANLNDEANFQFTNTSTGASAQAKYKWDVGTTGWQQIINGSGLGGGNADQMWFYSNTLGDVVLKLLPTGNVYITGDCSALSFTDRTPFYEGDAVAEIMAIKGKDGEIDHSTLPNFARKDKVVDVFEDIELVKDGKTLIEQTKVGENVEQYRDLGAMISMLVVAIQQLANRLTELEQ